MPCRLESLDESRNLRHAILLLLLLLVRNRVTTLASQMTVGVQPYRLWRNKSYVLSAHGVVYAAGIDLTKHFTCLIYGGKTRDR